MPVRFSTRAPNADYLGFEASPEAIVTAAKKAEEVGFDAIFVNDHIIVGNDARSAPWTNVYDPFVAMSFIAAHTTRIGVGVSVLITPYRNPIATAKALAELVERRAALRQACEALGREPIPTRMSFRVEFSTITGKAPPAGKERSTGHGTPAEVAADLLRYREAAGVEAFQINFQGNRNV